MLFYNNFWQGQPKNQSGESFFLRSVHAKYQRANQRRMRLCDSVECEVCDLQLSKSSSLKKHMESVHADEFVVLHKNLKASLITFNCFHCDEKFSNLKQLKHHNKNEHSHQESHSCIQCGKVFKKMKRLSSHVSAGYSGQIFKCLCEKQFGDKQAILQQAGENSEAACEPRKRQRLRLLHRETLHSLLKVIHNLLKSSASAFKKLVKTIIKYYCDTSLVVKK